MIPKTTKKYSNLDEITLRITNNFSPLMYQAHSSFYNLRNFPVLASTKKSDAKLGLETVSYPTPPMWGLLTSEIEVGVTNI